MKARRNARATRRRPAGLSIVEMMVVLLVVAILMTLGAPAMGTFVRNNRLQADALELVRTMHFARSEAVKRKTRVVLCRSADPLAATPSCGGTSYTWTTGWLVFASGDTNDTYQSGTDELLRIGLPASNDVSVRTNPTSNDSLEFNGDGSTNASGDTARFAICDGRGGAFGRQIDVPPVGRPVLDQGSASSPIDCTNPA